MGSDEQRVGRVDRMNGKMERELNSDITNPTLDIYYPYLKNTFDEENLKSMLCHKRKTENDIDNCSKVTYNEKDKQIFKCNKTVEELLHDIDKNIKNDSEPFGWEI